MRFAASAPGALALAAVLALGYPVNAANPSVSAVALDNLPGGQSSSAAAVNDLGLIVGWATTAGGHQHAVYWSAGGITDLGTLSGDTDSYASAVSGTGLIAGASGTGLLAPFNPENEDAHAVLWHDGSIQDLGTLFGGTFTVATGVNDAGQVVGCGRTWLSSEYPGSIRGFVWQDGEMTILEPPWPQTSEIATLSCATGINDRGDVVGYAAWSAVGSGTQTEHAVLWRNGAPADLGVLPGTTTSSGAAINGAGQVVGWSGSLEPGLSGTAVRWTGRHAHALASIPDQVFATAVALNSRGSAVGQCATASAMSGCRWQGSRVSILPPLAGDTTSTALGVNDAGIAVGYSQAADQTLQATRWDAKR